MTQEQAIIALRAQLLADLPRYGCTLPVIEAGQPSKQGRVNSGIYYQVIGTRNYGWQARRYDPTWPDARHIETQLYEATVQITALVDDDDSSIEATTLCQRIMHSLPFSDSMRAQGIGIQRATPVRQVRIIDDRDNYSIEASFDVVIGYQQDLRPVTGLVGDFDAIEIVRI